MRREDFPAYAQMWGMAWEQCGRTPSPDAIQLAFEALRDLPLDTVRKALIAHMRDPKAGQYPPKVADVIRHATGGHQDTREARAESAWRCVLDAIGSVGTYQTVVFDDPAIHYAIQIVFGSWEAVGLMTEDEQPFRRRDFTKAYMAFKSGLPYPPRLAGRFEREQAIADARFRVHAIGDPAKCKAVEAGGTSGGLVNLGHDVQALAFGGAA